MSTPPNMPRGTRLRGRCPECGSTRGLRTRSAHGHALLPAAVMAIHRDPRVTEYRTCAGVGQPPATVVSA